MTALETHGLTVRFGRGHEALTAVDDVDLTIAEQTIVGLVGESGSGKSTLARAIVGLVPISGGEVLLDGAAVRRGRTGHIAGLNRRVQMVFQDPFSSLTPRMTVGTAIAEAAGAGRRSSRAVRAREVEEHRPPIAGTAAGYPPRGWQGGPVPAASSPLRGRKTAVLIGRNGV